MWEKTEQVTKEIDDSKDGTGYSVLFRFNGAELEAFVRIAGEEGDLRAVDVLQPADQAQLRAYLEAFRDFLAAARGYNKA